jgi:hypothetical protein
MLNETLFAIISDPDKLCDEFGFTPKPYWLIFLKIFLTQIVMGLMFNDGPKSESWLDARPKRYMVYFVGYQLVTGVMNIVFILRTVHLSGATSWQMYERLELVLALSSSTLTGVQLFVTQAVLDPWFQAFIVGDEEGMNAAIEAKANNERYRQESEEDGASEEALADTLLDGESTEANQEAERTNDTTQKNWLQWLKEDYPGGPVTDVVAAQVHRDKKHEKFNNMLLNEQAGAVLMMVGSPAMITHGWPMMLCYCWVFVLSWKAMTTTYFCFFGKDQESIQRVAVLVGVLLWMLVCSTCVTYGVLWYHYTGGSVKPISGHQYLHIIAMDYNMHDTDAFVRCTKRGLLSKWATLVDYLALL